MGWVAHDRVALPLKIISNLEKKTKASTAKNTKPKKHRLVGSKAGKKTGEGRQGTYPNLQQKWRRATLWEDE